jgi:hypothetical protein
MQTPVGCALRGLEQGQVNQIVWHGLAKAEAAAILPSRSRITASPHTSILKSNPKGVCGRACRCERLVAPVAAKSWQRHNQMSIDAEALNSL